MRRRNYIQESISNLSIGLIDVAFTLLARQALPVYRKNMGRGGFPAGTENVPSAAAILLMNAGLDYHLCRLKYLRDIAPHSFPLPHTPYFNWEIDDVLSNKIGKLLLLRNEYRLKEQLLEVTVIRDCVVHPKLYTIRQTIDSDLNFGSTSAALAPGASHKRKALDRKMKRVDYTRLLHLPLIPTWISYVDAVLCVMVVHRFLNLLESRYGNYARLGPMLSDSHTKDNLSCWDGNTRDLLEIPEWVNAFFNSLSAGDKERARKVLGGRIRVYLNKALSYPKNIRTIGTVTDIVESLRNPSKPDFLRKPPPWSTTKTPSP